MFWNLLLIVYVKKPSALYHGLRLGGRGMGDEGD
jgi:hypothetical protein